MENFLMMAGFFLTFVVTIWRMNASQIKRIDRLFGELRGELRAELNELRSSINDIDRRLSRVEGILQTLPLFNSLASDIPPASSVETKFGPDEGP